MSDIFRKSMDNACDVGGVKCDCCNKWKGKARKQLNRIVRRRLKNSLKKEIEETENEN